MKGIYEYTELYRYKDDKMEKVIYIDNTISRPLFKVEATYILPTGDKVSNLAYIGGDVVKVMMEVVKQYEEEAKAN
jgi:hypothetical protein